MRVVYPPASALDAHGFSGFTTLSLLVTCVVWDVLASNYVPTLLFSRIAAATAKALTIHLLLAATHLLKPGTGIATRRQLQSSRSQEQVLPATTRRSPCQPLWGLLLFGLAPAHA